MRLSKYIEFLQDFQKGRNDDPEVYNVDGRSNQCTVLTTIDDEKLLLVSSMDSFLGTPLPELKG